MEPVTRTSVPSRRSLRALARKVKGEVITPQDPEYASARLVWNGMIDRHPAAIVRCTDVDDVVATVRAAKAEGTLLAVGGGRHNVAGFATCDGGIDLDLSPMKRIEIDVPGRRVRVQGGCRWGEVDAATQAHGLATPGGVVSETGVAGLTLGGGMGWLRGALGLSCDNLLEAQVVTADGRVRRASEDENPDLFWGLRGGGGNFGVVTEFTFRLHEVGPEVAFCAVFHDGRGPGMKRTLQAFRDYAENGSAEAAPLVVCGTFPPGNGIFPPALDGVPFAALVALHRGPDLDEAERLLAPLRDFAEPLLDLSGRMPYVKAQTMLDAEFPAHELRYYWKSLQVDRLDDEVLDHLVAMARRQPSPYSTVDVWAPGAAVRRVPEDAMAYTGRGPEFLVNVEANWPAAADDDANIRWVRESLDELRPFSSGVWYLNFPGFHEGGRRAMEDLFGSKYQRLAALKRQYDPTNLFRLNQNVAPQA